MTVQEHKKQPIYLIIFVTIAKMFKYHTVAQLLAPYKWLISCIQEIACTCRSLLLNRARDCLWVLSLLLEREIISIFNYKPFWKLHKPQK